jgi:hypothetical protein
MNATTPLKLSAVVFTILWTGWMLWWSGSLDLANVIILAICGSAAGYVWYRVMRWQFERRGMLRQDERPARSAAKR